METSFDAIVIGAGIVGAACAHRLVMDGMRVAIVEPGTIGGSATAAGMGHIVVMDDSPAQFALTRYSQQLWDELARELPPEAEFQRIGTLWVAADGEELAEVERKQALYRDYDVPAEAIEAAELRDIEPKLGPGLAGALRVPGDAIVLATRVAEYLVETCLKAGSRLFENTAVHASKGLVKLDAGLELTSGRIINAAGAYASLITPGLPMRLRKGHLAMTEKHAGFVRHEIVELGYLKSAQGLAEDSVAFNVQPRATGEVLIGSSRQFGSTSPDVEEPLLSRMLDRAYSYMPDLRTLKITRSWAGFRVATPDKLPLVGPTADPSIYLAGGHEGLGVTTATATAELLASLFSGRQLPIPIEPYLPTRPMPPWPAWKS